MKKAIFVLAWFSSCVSLYAYSVDVPQTVMQGEPLVVAISGESAATVTHVVMGKQSARPVLLNGTYRAVFGIDIDHKVGNISLVLKEGMKIVKTVSVEVIKRSREEHSFAIPKSLGGTTKKGEKTVTTGLAKENALLEKLTSHPKTLFTEPFRFPLATTTVTDVYGYTRTTEGTSITHKGTDFKAPSGTEVYAMNRGVVRLAKKLTVYGNTVVIDHGNGISTLYMHLSTISPKLAPGTLVTKGQRLGKSGQTGYALGAHLHVSIKVFGVSIDPLMFMNAFGEASSQ